MTPPTFAAFVCATLVLTGMCPAADPAPQASPPRPTEESARISRAVEEVLRSPEYRWRMPRNTATEQDNPYRIELDLSFLDRLADSLEKGFHAFGRFLRWIDGWLDKLFRTKKQKTPSSTMLDLPPRPLIFFVAAIVSATLGIVLYRAWRRRHTVQHKTVATPVEAQPDPMAETTTADLLPMDRWMTMAHELIAKGHLRAAMRAMFLASLSCLAQQGVITLAKHKSNREYLRELERRAHDRRPLIAGFAQNTRVLESVWYGNTDATADHVSAFADNTMRILTAFLPPQDTTPPHPGGPVL